VPLRLVITEARTTGIAVGAHHIESRRSRNGLDEFVAAKILSFDRIPQRSTSSRDLLETEGIEKRQFQRGTGICLGRRGSGSQISLAQDHLSGPGFSRAIRRSGWVGSKWTSSSDGAVTDLRALRAAILFLTSSWLGFWAESGITALGAIGAAMMASVTIRLGIPLSS